MTRKDYVALAQVVKSLPNSVQSGLTFKASLVDKLCQILAADNKKFDKAQFIRACGFGG